MDLKELDEKYKKLKASVSAKSAEVEAKSKEVEAEVKKQEIYLLEYQLAEKTGAKDVNAKKDLYEKQTKKIESVSGELKKLKTALEKIQDEIDKCMEELQKDPELKEHLMNAINKKHQNKAKKVYKEIEEKMEEKTNLESYKEVVENHPFVIGECERIAEKTREKQIILDNMTPQTEAQDLKDIKAIDSEIKGMENNISNYCKTSKENVSNEKIKDIIKLLVAEGEKDVNLMLDSKIKVLDKQIKSKTKTVNQYEYILKINVKENKEEQQVDEVEEVQSEAIFTDVKEEWQEVEEAEEESKKTLIPTIIQKVKDMWTRFKNRKQKSLPAGGEKVEEEKTEKEETVIEEEMEQTVELQKEVEETKTTSTAWKDSFKYEIVKDFAENKQMDDLRNAKKEIKKSDEGR